MADKELRVDLTVEGAAEGAEAIDKVADAAERVEDLGAVTLPVEVDTAAAEGDVRQLVDDVEDVRPKLTVEVDEAAVRKARGRIDDSLGAPGTAGKRFGASFAGDVGDVFGQQASGIGRGLADGVATAFESAGLADTRFAGALTAALGVGTVAVAAGLALWQALTASGKAYEEQVKKVGEAHEELATGDIARTAKIIQENYGKVIEGAQRYGFTAGQVTDTIVGNNDRVIESLEAQLERLSESREAWTPEGVAARDALQKQVDGIKSAQRSWQESGLDRRAARAEIDQITEAVNRIPTDKRVLVTVDFRSAGDKRATSLVYDPDVGLRQTVVPGAPVTNITVNAGFGSDAFAIGQAVATAAGAAARLTQGAARASTGPRRRS